MPVSSSTLSSCRPDRQFRLDPGIVEIETDIPCNHLSFPSHLDSFFFKQSGLRVSHSQMVRTSQSNARNSRSFLASLSIFFSNLSAQKAVLVLGVVEYLQPS